MCRSRRELSNAYLLAKIGVDTAENEPLEVWGENSIQYSLHSLGTSVVDLRIPGDEGMIVKAAPTYYEIGCATRGREAARVDLAAAVFGLVERFDIEPFN